MKGIKHDQGKLRYGLIKPEAHREMAKVMMNGAAKYGDENWKMVEQSRYLEALLRHIEEWRLGTRIDRDSGLRTLAHVAACAHIMLQKEIEAAEAVQLPLFTELDLEPAYTDLELEEMYHEYRPEEDEDTVTGLA